MEYLCLLLFQAGRPKSAHSKAQSRRIRGVLSVAERRIAERHRMVRVAELRVTLGGQEAAPPPLMDADLLVFSADFLVLSGFESITAGPLGEPAEVRQAWHLTPAPLEGLIRAEGLVNRLAGRLAELGHPVDLSDVLKPR